MDTLPSTMLGSLAPGSQNSRPEDSQEESTGAWKVAFPKQALGFRVLTRTYGNRGQGPGEKSSMEPEWPEGAGRVTGIILSSSVTEISNVSPPLPNSEVNINQNPE